MSRSEPKISIDQQYTILVREWTMYISRRKHEFLEILKELKEFAQRQDSPSSEKAIHESRLHEELLRIQELTGQLVQNERMWKQAGVDEYGTLYIGELEQGSAHQTKAQAILVLQSLAASYESARRASQALHRILQAERVLKKQVSGQDSLAARVRARLQENDPSFALGDDEDEEQTGVPTSKKRPKKK